MCGYAVLNYEPQARAVKGVGLESRGLALNNAHQ